MSTVVLSGAADPLGHRVAAALGRLDGVERIIALDEHDLHCPDLKSRIEGADALVHLSGGVDDTHALLDAAGAVGVTHVVLMSSATAYGAWANNPVPLTEDAPLRPNPDLDFAVRAAERERLASGLEARASRLDRRRSASRGSARRGCERMARARTA